MSRASRIRYLGLTGAAVFVAATASAAFWADNEPDNVIALGGFERAALSLRLPLVSPFPLVVGGWGARAGDEAISLRQDNPWEGQRSVQIEARKGAPAHLIQDVPLATRSFRLEIAVMRLRGRQTLRLSSNWDRMDPAHDAALEIQVGRAGLRLISSAGSWPIAATFQSGRWLHLGLIADARSAQVGVFVDGELRATLPVAFARPPQTLSIGGDGLGSSIYRYDGLRLERLAEVELAAIRRQARRWVPATDLPYLMRHLDTAAVVLAQGAPTLATPELRAALRMLDGLKPAAAPGSTGLDGLTGATELLIELTRTS